MKKSDTFESYKDYEAWCATQLNKKVKIFHLDQGGEYLGKVFILHLNSQGMKQKLTVHNSDGQGSFWGLAGFWRVLTL